MQVRLSKLCERMGDIAIVLYYGRRREKTHQCQGSGIEKTIDKDKDIGEARSYENLKEYRVPFSQIMYLETIVFCVFCFC